MTETEKRRMDLLQQTRKAYSARYSPPAVHPRYQATYQSLYGEDIGDAEDMKKGTFGVRMTIAVLLFCLFAAAKYNGVKETETVANEIQKEYHSLVDFPIFD